MDRLAQRLVVLGLPLLARGEARRPLRRRPALLFEGRPLHWRLPASRASRPADAVDFLESLRDALIRVAPEPGEAALRWHPGVARIDGLLK